MATLVLGAGCQAMQPYPANTPLADLCEATTELAASAAAGRSGYQALVGDDRQAAHEAATKALFHHQQAQALIGRGGLRLDDNADQRADWTATIDAVQATAQAAELMAMATISTDPPALDQWDRLVRDVENGVGTIHLPAACKVLAISAPQ